MPFFIKRVKRFVETVYLETGESEDELSGDGEYIGVTDIDICEDFLIPCGADGNTEGSSADDVIFVEEISGPYDTKEEALASDDAGVEWT